MEQEITMELVESKAQKEEFWKEKNRYLVKDTFPNCDIGGSLTREEQAWFFSKEYRSMMEELCARDVDQAKAYFFKQGEERIGITLYCTYQSQDGRCFIFDYCIFPEFRGQGIGKQCFSILEQQARKEGATYFELNAYGHRTKRFWESLGFQYNGFDSNKILLLLKKPNTEETITYEQLDAKDIWQILNLENSYRYEMDEDFLSKETQEELKNAIVEEKIYFFVAKRKTRVIGMCSISTVYSTTQTGYMGIFEDMYIEPIFRKKGRAKELVNFAFAWCKEHGVNTVCVGSAENDKAIYGKLGFTVFFGRMLAWLA